MSTEQCWALQGADQRCQDRAEPGSHFCALHSRRGGPLPAHIWRESGMPPDLMEYVRPLLVRDRTALAALEAPVSSPPEPPTEAPARRSPGPGEPAGTPLSDTIDLTVTAATGRGSESCGSAALERQMVAAQARHSRRSSPPSSLVPPDAAAGPEGPGTPDPSTAAAASEAAPSLDWFLGLLQEAMTQVMAGEATPLQKANAVARLGALYLKACRAAELEKSIPALEQRVAELEQRAAGREPPAAEANAAASRRPSPRQRANRTKEVRPAEATREAGREPRAAAGEAEVHAQCRAAAQPADGSGRIGPSGVITADGRHGASGAQRRGASPLTTPPGLPP